MRWASALVRLQALTGELQHCLPSLTLASHHSSSSSSYTSPLSFCVTFRGVEWALLCRARRAHLYQVSMPWKVFWEKERCFEHLSAHSHLPLNTLPMGTSECARGVHVHRNSKTIKATCCWFETLMETHSPLLLLQQTHQTTPLFVVSVGSAVPHLDPSFLRIKLNQSWLELELSETQNVGMSPSALWHLELEGQEECNGAQWEPLWTLASGQMAGLDPWT